MRVFRTRRDVIEFLKERILSCREVTDEYDITRGYRIFEAGIIDWDGIRKKKRVGYKPGDEKEVEDLRLLAIYEFCLGIRIDA
jgi:hypothetical protein